MHVLDSAGKDSVTKVSTAQTALLCEECRNLLNAFGDAVRDVVTLNELHFRAVVGDEPDPHRFDSVIQEANERKQNAKQAYVHHRETHGCT